MIAFKPRSIVDHLRLRAREMPDATAFTFLADGERESDTLTFGELDRRSRAIAAFLQRRHKAGERALLLYPPGLDFIAAFFGALYAGVVAVPVCPPHPTRAGREMERCRAIAADAGAAVVLGTEAMADPGRALISDHPSLERAHWVSTTNLPLRDAEFWEEVDLREQSLAFLQYTSGSTAAPKGVMVSHGNILHNLSYINQVVENDEKSVSVSWLPVYHDMGLINGILLPVFFGYPSYLMAPVAFLQRPVRWLRAISRYRGTNSGGPNFAYELCVRKVTDEERQSLDLGSWRVAYNGAEPIRWETLRRFYDTFRGSGFRWNCFYPVYGLAEATLLVSSGYLANEPKCIALDRHALAADVARIRRAADPGTAILPLCGGLSCGTDVAVVDPATRRRRAAGQIGEIWVRSRSVALGYWNRPVETRQAFGARIAPDGDGPFLRTGDLGFLIEDELVITGRIKDLIIVRGEKYYPQDIERTVEACHEAIRPGSAAAFAIEGEQGERLAVVAELDRRYLRSSSIIEKVPALIRDAVAERHALRPCLALLLPPGTTPKTSSGKLQRHACRSALRNDSLRSIARWSDPGRFSTGAAP